VSFIKSLLRETVTWLLSHTDFDLRLAKLRLRQFNALGAELSAAFSAQDCPGQPNPRLIDLALAAACRARDVQLTLLTERRAPSFVHIWPGEHYRLLDAIVREMAPRLVLEIGTYTGMSALAMLPALPREGKLITVDIVPWDEITGTLLTPADFIDGRLRQLVCDLGQLAAARKHAALLQNADMLFIDGPKDGLFEYSLHANLHRVGLKAGSILVFDDIRVWNMLRL